MSKYNYKIAPKSILPYVKASIPADSNTNATNVSNALSSSVQHKQQTIENLLGVLTAAAAKNVYIKQETTGHLGSVLTTWRNRKT